MKLVEVEAEEGIEREIEGVPVVVVEVEEGMEQS